MSRTVRIWILLFVLIISVACSIPAFHSDPFYSAWEEWGAARFPLIKPYEVYNDGGNGGWVIDLDFSLRYHRSSEMLFYSQIKYIEKVTLVDDVILVYSPYEQKNTDIQKVLYWFVIIPGDTEDTDDDIVRGFDKESDFLVFVKEYEIENVTWESPEEINKKFVTTGCLDWIPGCN